MDISQAPDPSEERRPGSGRRTRGARGCIRTSARLPTGSPSTSWRRRTRRSRRLPLRRRERSRSVSVRRRRPDRGRLRPARAHGRRGDLRALRALRRRAGTAATPPRAAARSSTSVRTSCDRRDGPAPTRPACRSFPGLVRYDEVAGRRDRPRAAVHGGLHHPALRVAGAAPGGRRRPALPADGSAVPAPRWLRLERVLGREPRWSCGRCSATA